MTLTPSSELAMLIRQQGFDDWNDWRPIHWPRQGRRFLLALEAPITHQMDMKEPLTFLDILGSPFADPVGDAVVEALTAPTSIPIPLPQRRRWRWVTPPLCECGCGEPVRKQTSGGWSRWKHGHARRCGLH